MSKRFPTFVCRKSDNSELMKCICGMCEAESLKAQLAQAQARIEKLERVKDAAINYLKSDNPPDYGLSKRMWDILISALDALEAEKEPRP